MGHPIADNPEALFRAHDAELESSVARAELRNAKAVADKLQTEMANTRRANELLANAANRFQARCEEAESTIDAMLEILRPHAGPVFDEAGTPLDAARYVVSRITTDPEPDIDTVPLADLLEAVGTYLEHDQAVTIRGSFDAVRHVEIHAMGLTFAVETHEASESLTKLQELGGCLVVEAAR